MRVVAAFFAAAIAAGSVGCSSGTSPSNNGPSKIGDTVTFSSDGTRLLDVAVTEVVAVPEHCVYLDDDNQKVPALGVKLRVTTADHFGPIIRADDFTATVDGAEQQVVNSAGWGPRLDGCDQQFPSFIDNYLPENTTADGWVILRNPGNLTALTFTPDVPKTKLFEVKDREDLAILTLSPRKMTVEVSVASNTALPTPSSSPAATSPREVGTTTAKTAPATTVAPTSEITAAPTSPGPVRPPEGVRCTDLLDYSGDSRSNAEINSIGASTGVCPTPIESDSEPSAVPFCDGETCTYPSGRITCDPPTFGPPCYPPSVLNGSDTEQLRHACAAGKFLLRSQCVALGLPFGG